MNKDENKNLVAHSEYVGSLDKQTPEKNFKEKRKNKGGFRKFKRGNNRGFMSSEFPNRHDRRKFAPKSKDKYKLTPEEVAQGKTFFSKMGEVISDNVRHGKMLHEAWLEHLAYIQMQWEKDKNEKCKQSLIEAFGQELGMKVYDNNRRLQGLYMDKKILM